MAVSKNYETEQGIDNEIVEMLLRKHFFFSHLLQQCKRHYVDNDHPCKTLGVNITDDLRPNLYVNWSFYNSLSQDQRIALLEHEMLHLLNKHLIRREDRDSYIWNLATDVAINQYLTNLPEGGFCPDCNIFVPKENNGKFPSKCPQCNKKLDPKKNKCEGLTLNNVIAGDKTLRLPAEDTSEHYFELIYDAMPKIAINIGSSQTDGKNQDAKEQMGEGSGGQGEENQEQQGSGKEGQEQKQNKQQGSGNIEVDGQNVPTSIDSHEIWETGSDNKEMAHQKVKEMVSKAIEKMNSEDRQQGNIPGYLQNLINEILKHKALNWRSELRRFVGYEEFAKLIPTRKRLNRRYPTLFGSKVLRKADILVAVDSSGSIGDDEFGRFFKEIEVMKAAGVSITVVECDMVVQDVYKYKKRPQISRKGYGGTSFVPVFDFVREKRYDDFKLKKKPDGVIYLTDGEGTFPRKDRMGISPNNVIWVMVPTYRKFGNLEHDNDRGVGKVIVMNDEK